MLLGQKTGASAAIANDDLVLLQKVHIQNRSLLDGQILSPHSSPL